VRAGILEPALCLGLLLVCSSAAASPEDDRNACGAAFSKAPDLIKAGRLLEARDALVQCAADPCPANMRPLCAGDLRNLEPQVPTVVFVAKTSRGEDVITVRVTDGARSVVDRLDGRAIPLDPGPHRFRFETADGVVVEVPALLHEGEKLRAVTAVLPPNNREEGRDSGQGTSTRPIPWTVYALSGVAAVATASFAYFGVRGLNERAALASCEGSCPHDEVQAVRDSYLVANVSLGVAIVAAGVAVTLFVVRPSVTVATTGTGALLRADF
jgi:hypothetical protein